MTKMIQMAALVAMATLAACGKKDDPDPQPQPNKQVSRAMFVNACTGTSAGVTVTLNDQALTGVSSIPYLGNTGYVELAPTAQAKTTFRLQGSNLKLSEATQDYTVNTYYSVFATGLVTSPSIFITTDDVAAPAGNTAKVRFVNLSPEKLNETVYIGEKKIDSNVNYNEATAFAQVTAGTYNVIVQDPANVPLVQSLQQQQFSAGKVYTIMLTGTRDASGNEALKLTVVGNN